MSGARGPARRRRRTTRGPRAGPRPEIPVALLVSLAFGLFHLTNVFTGSPLGGGIFQVILASITGFALYLARRGTGLLVAGMVLHGFWDVSTFLVQSKPDVQTVGTGIAFGLWSDGGRALPLLAAVCIVLLLLWGSRYARQSGVVGWSLALLVGGALGNMVDRIRGGRVTDFIDLSFWPVFNFADTLSLIHI